MKEKSKNQKIARNAFLGLATVAVAAGMVATTQPAFAGKALRAACMVDPELESALRNHFKKRFFNLIDADESQKEQISALFATQVEDVKPVREKIRENMMDLSVLIADENASDEAIRKKVEELRALKEDIHQKRLDTALKVRALLTKEQKETVSNRLKGFLTGGASKLGRG